MLSHAKNQGKFWQRVAIVAVLFAGLLGAGATQQSHHLAAFNDGPGSHIVVADSSTPPPIVH